MVIIIHDKDENGVIDNVRQENSQVVRLRLTSEGRKRTSVFC